MIPFRSIRWRLQLWYGLLIASLLTGCGIVGYRLERALWLDRIDDELSAIAHAMGARPPRPGGPARNLPPGMAANLFSPRHRERGIYYARWTRNFEPFTASENAPREIPKPTEGPPTARWRGTLREAIVGTNPGDFVLVGRDVSTDLAQLHRLGWKIAGGIVGILGLTLAIGQWIVTRALRPIRDIGAAAQKIATGDLAQRIDTRDTESELGQLAAVLNSTFARLEASFAQQARFTADAAHELRTPVTVILTHAQNALGSPDLVEEQREALEAVQRAAQRMRRLIESLLRLARIDAGQESAAHAPLDLAELAREGAELIDPLAAARGIRVHLDLSPALARGDRDGLGQVLANLLTNAVHHNYERGEIRVSTRIQEGHALVSVADDGPGIAAEHLPHVFERFYRVDKARTAAAGRTGLGLAIVKAIVDAHGGEITVRSRPQEGATFTVRLAAAT